MKKHVFGRLGKLSYLININQVKRVIIKLEKVKFICEWNAPKTMDIDVYSDSYPPQGLLIVLYEKERI